jgi:hypothetical protein
MVKNIASHTDEARHLMLPVEITVVVLGVKVIACTVKDAKN